MSTDLYLGILDCSSIRPSASLVKTFFRLQAVSIPLETSPRLSKQPPTRNYPVSSDYSDASPSLSTFAIIFRLSPCNHARRTMCPPRAITDLCTWQVQSGEGIGHLQLRPCRALRISVSDEELNDFPAVHAASPLCISSHVRGAGDTEYTQAVFATDDVVSVPIQYCLDWFVVNVRRSSS